MAGPQRPSVKARTGEKRPLYPKGSGSWGKPPAGGWSDLGVHMFMLAVTQRKQGGASLESTLTFGETTVGSLKAMVESVAKVAAEGSGLRTPSHTSLTCVP